MDPSVNVDIAIVGLGEFGLEHLRICLTVPGVNVVAVADTNSVLAKKIAMTFGIPRWFSDPLALIETVRLDGITIVTPASSHLLLTRAAVAHNIAVLVEKPIIANISEAVEMLKLSTRGIVIPAHILRFARPYVELFEKTRGEVLGQIAGLSARRHRNIDHISRFPTTNLVLMTMVHDIDQAMWLTGSKARSVTAQSYHIRNGINPDLVFATVRDAEDRIWDLCASWLITNTEIPDQLEMYTSQGIETVSSAGHDFGDSMRKQIEHFAQCIRDHQKPKRITVLEALHGIAIADAIMRSASSGGTAISV